MDRSEIEQMGTESDILRGINRNGPQMDISAQWRKLWGWVGGAAASPIRHDSEILGSDSVILR